MQLALRVWQLFTAVFGGCAVVLALAAAGASSASVYSVASLTAVGLAALGMALGLWSVLAARTIHARSWNVALLSLNFVVFVLAAALAAAPLF
jgi:hypothetical protein